MDTGPNCPKCGQDTWPPGARCGECEAKEEVLRLQQLNDNQAIRIGERGEEVDRLLCSLEFAWTIIANAHEGDWSRGKGDWRDAAAIFRDDHYLSALDRNPHFGTNKTERE